MGRAHGEDVIVPDDQDAFAIERPPRTSLSSEENAQTKTQKQSDCLKRAKRSVEQ
jgi:hypothetical protein